MAKANMTGRAKSTRTSIETCRDSLHRKWLLSPGKGRVTIAVSGHTSTSLRARWAIAKGPRLSRGPKKGKKGRKRMKIYYQGT